MKYSILGPLLLVVAMPASGQVVQMKSVISAGGQHASAGGRTLSSDLGDLIIGSSAQGTVEVWHGFYAPQPQPPLGVDGPVVTVVDYLGRPSPNPALHSTTIEFGLAAPEPSFSLAVFDVSGRLVRRLAEGPRARGVFRIRWDLRSGSGTLVGPGLYFVRRQTRSFAASTRLVVVR